MKWTEREVLEDFGGCESWDMSKAFDKVNHKILLYQFSKFGMEGKLL